MSRIRLKQVDQISRKTVSDARDSFLRHCQLKNLAPHTYTYYKENLQFFFDSMLHGLSRSHRLTHDIFRLFPRKCGCPKAKEVRR